MQQLYSVLACLSSEFCILTADLQVFCVLVIVYVGEGLLSRKSSGNVYDDFPCVRVGDYDLPSSMDLRQYLDEMQQVGDWEGDPELPTIPDDEVCLCAAPQIHLSVTCGLSSFHMTRCFCLQRVMSHLSRR